MLIGGTEIYLGGSIMNDLRRSLKRGENVFGTFLRFSDPAIVEILGYSGFDFVIIDLEHGSLDIPQAENIVRAAQVAKIVPIIRVRENNSSLIARALDIGAAGVQVPHITSEEDAQDAVTAARFYPEGRRGVCRFARAAYYTHLDKYEYFNKANSENLIILQIEGVKGIDNLDKILMVKGIDMIFIGPYDLSQSLGLPGDVNNQLVIQKMQEVINMAIDSGVAVGTFVDDVANAIKWTSIGVQYLAYSVDVGMFYQSASLFINQLKSK
jgi:4-hydroxy-2-oxoheptanedioate aldolase